MGYQNAHHAYGMFPGLPHRAFRMLVHMALVSADNDAANGDPARMYWGGAEALARSIGYEGESALSVSAGKQVQRTIRELIAAGAVVRVAEGRPGRSAVYQLRLDPMRREEPNRFLAGNRFGSQEEPFRFQEGTVSVPPKESEDNNIRGRRTSSQESTSPAPVDNPSDQTEIDAARTTLEACAPARYAAAIAQAMTEGHTENQAAIIRAAQIVKGTAA